MPTNDRIRRCAQFIEDELEASGDTVDGDILEELISESALAAGFLETEVEAAWALVDNQEGA